MSWYAIATIYLLTSKKLLMTGARARLYANIHSHKMQNEYWLSMYRRENVSKLSEEDEKEEKKSNTWIMIMHFLTRKGIPRDMCEMVCVRECLCVKLRRKKPNIWMQSNQSQKTVYPYEKVCDACSLDFFPSSSSSSSSSNISDTFCEFYLDKKVWSHQLVWSMVCACAKRGKNKSLFSFRIFGNGFSVFSGSK